VSGYDAVFRYIIDDVRGVEHMGLGNHVATSEQDYTQEENEVLKAVMEHREKTGRVFLSNIEVFRFLKSMGYKKESPIIAGDVRKLPVMKQRTKKFLPPPDDDLV
jgi:hypothetical protein